MSSIYDSSEIIGAFLDELEEQLQLLEEGILELEQNGETPEVIQKIFRVAHTLKGSSSAMGFDKMKTLTHEMENVLDKIRNKRLEATKPVVDILFECADYLRILKEEFAANRDEIKTNIDPVIDGLKEILAGQLEEKHVLQKSSAMNAAEDRPIQENPSADILISHLSAENPLAVNSESFHLDLEHYKFMEKAAENGLHNLICTVRILEESPMKATRACLILNYFNELGTVVSTIPNVLELPNDTDVREISYLLISELDPSALQSKAQIEIMDIESIQVKPFPLSSAQEKGHKSEPKSGKKRQNAVKLCDAEKNHKPAEGEKKVAQTVRVDVERLEKMMNLVGELVIEQTRIAQVGGILYNRYTSDNAVDDLLGISNHISRVINELQEVVMKARMLPIQQLFNRFPRMVRDLAQSLNKEVDLVLEGGETEMDRTIIEDINDPLIHIIRNAIDHGIETREERIKSGKPEKGTVRITAFHQENHVILTIEDDGSGIDVDKIKDTAVKKQLITQQEAESLSDHDAVNLIFHTGFSTAKTVSDVSGRGVGMDIVRNHIDKLNGIIDVETKVGHGTKFIIKLPLTLAILTGLLVKINDDTFAIPMSNVLEIVRKPEEEIKSVKGQFVAVIRERVHPLIWLHDYFNIPRRKKRKNVFIVVLGVAEKRFGLVVDELVGNQEIVVKPLGSYIGKIEGFSGATILGDGSVACILDVVGIAKMISSLKVSEYKDNSIPDVNIPNELMV